MITNNQKGIAGNDKFKGYSTSVKPTQGVGINSIFWELDTGKKYYFDGTAWQEIPQEESGGMTDGVVSISGEVVDDNYILTATYADGTVETFSIPTGASPINPLTITGQEATMYETILSNIKQMASAQTGTNVTAHFTYPDISTIVVQILSGGLKTLPFLIVQGTNTRICAYHSSNIAGDESSDPATVTWQNTEIVASENSVMQYNFYITISTTDLVVFQCIASASTALPIS